MRKQPRQHHRKHLGWLVCVVLAHSGARAQEPTPTPPADSAPAEGTEAEPAARTAEQLAADKAAAEKTADKASLKDSKIVQQYMNTVTMGAGTAPKIEIDPRLKGVFTEKIMQCYAAEEGNEPLTGTDRALIDYYGSELALQMSGAFIGTSCDPNHIASDQCLQELGLLTCETLARAISSLGWDRAPSPEMERAIKQYGVQLAGRHVLCRGQDKVDIDEAKVLADYESNRHANQVTMLVVTGQCSLEMTQLDACLSRVKLASCDEINAKVKVALLPRFCAEFLECGAEPEAVKKIVDGTEK